MHCRNDIKLLVILFLLLESCTKQLHVPKGASSISGSEFYKQAAGMGWKQRDSVAVQYLLRGNMPVFLHKLVPVHTTVTDSNGKMWKATYYVTKDYISIGQNSDWARVPLTPNGAQKLADSLYCFLPTRKMVDEIYKAARVKLEPMPMFAFRDSTPTMYQHHLIIEGQRQGRKGLIGGIKKDLVMSDKVRRDPKPNRVAIYGWHKLDGKPIQPLYTGHVDWYVDYSHGVRLVYRKIRVAGKWMDYKEVLQHPLYKKLLCDEEYCEPYNYRY